MIDSDQAGAGGATRTALRLALAFGASAALVAAIVLPFAFQMRPYTVMSGSMEPAIAAGDLVLVRRVAPTDLRLGDVATFHDPTRKGRLITHRVRQLAVTGPLVKVVTRGDANTGVERWQTPVNRRVGRVVFRLPRLGYVFKSAGGPTGRLLLIVIPVLLIGATVLIDLWRQPTPELSA